MILHWRAARLLGAVIVAAAFALASTEAHAQDNVAAGKSVTYTGSLGGSTDWPDPTPADPSTITDGVIAPDGQHWQGADPGNVRTVWWAGDQTIFEIALGDRYDITRVLLNADNNDDYEIRYWNQATNGWTLLFRTYATPQAYPPNYWGMATWDVALATPIMTTKFQLRGTDPDYLYSVSEFQAFGTVVTPEPATVLLMATGLAGVAVVARRRRRSPHTPEATT